jgi:general secretion pathway protein L
MPDVLPRLSPAPDLPAAPPGVTLIATEHVLLLAQALPAMTAGQRRAAIAFAVEDRVAQPLDSVHILLGPALSAAAGQGDWLVAVIGRDVLAACPRLPGSRLVPDALLLPVPAAGQWSVWVSERANGDLRVLVRTPDGAGFATTQSALPYFHLAAGRPALMLHGGTLEPQFTVVGTAALPAVLDPALRRFDLQQARQLQHALTLPRNLQRMAALLAFGVLGHTAILATDAWALDRARTMVVDRLRGTLAVMGPTAAGDVDIAIATLLATTPGSQSPQFLPMLSQATAALAPLAGTVTMADLRYDGGVGQLTLTLQAPDIATLQQAETGLRNAGFALTAGAATTGDGLAQQPLTLQGGGI